jgi:hypothetical protein
MNDDQLLRANAYLDDDLSPDERAVAEADAEVMAEVTRLRDVRTALRDVEAPGEGRREGALAAALAAFDGTAGASLSPVPRPSRTRRAWYPLGVAAAALLAVVTVGIVASRGGDQGGDDASTAATLSGGASAALAASGGTATATAAAPAPGDAAGTGDTAADLEATSEAAADAAAPASAPGPVLRSLAELAAFASTRTPLEQATVAGTCAAGALVGPATYVADGVDVAVLVFVVGDQAVAVDAGTCGEVARADLP